MMNWILQIYTNNILKMYSTAPEILINAVEDENLQRVLLDVSHKIFNKP